MRECDQDGSRRSCRLELGTECFVAGKFFGVHDVTGRRWAEKGPPPPVAKLLRLMVALRFTPAYVDSMTG